MRGRHVLLPMAMGAGVFQIALFVSIQTGLAEVPTKIPPDKERGEALYRELCASCHGNQALGNSITGHNLGFESSQLALAGRIQTKDFKSAIEVIQFGRGLMPAYEQQIDKHESKRILLWLESLDAEKGADLPKSDSEDTENGIIEEAVLEENQDARTSDTPPTENKNFTPSKVKP